MTDEEQKEKYREWLFGLAKEGCETKFMANVKVFEGKRDDGAPYVRAYTGDENYVVFSPMEWLSMYLMALSILHSKQLHQARPPKGCGILDQIERDNPDK